MSRVMPQSAASHPTSIARSQRSGTGNGTFTIFETSFYVVFLHGQRFLLAFSILVTTS